jgi:hypothetical protein
MVFAFHQEGDLSESQHARAALHGHPASCCEYSQGLCAIVFGVQCLPVQVG